MKYCKKCVQTDTRPHIFFTDEGICGACQYAEEKKNINWDERGEQLKNIVQHAKHNAENYDCVIGVSGGKDSLVQSIYARDKLGLRCLLVNGEPENRTEIGHKNIENLKKLGFDMISMRANPNIMKKLIRRDFYKYMNPVKVTEFTLWASAYIIADYFKIPLIVQGENDSLTFGLRDGQGRGDDALMITEQNTLASGWEDYIDDVNDPMDLFFYHFNKERLRMLGTRGIWLQYYMKEWSPRNNMNFAIKHGMTCRNNEHPEDYGTYINGYHLDGNLQQLNQMIKFIKFGFGQTTDDACYDIRDGYITREKGMELVRKYDGKCAKRFIVGFCEYIGITEDEFWKEVNKHRGPMWKKEKGRWVLEGREEDNVDPY